MGGLSPIHWIIIAAAALLLFGGSGKLSGLMGDAAKGVKAFRDGMKDDAAPVPATPILSPIRTEPDPNHQAAGANGAGT